MSRINKKKEGFRKDSHLNFMGGPSYDISNPIFKLRLAGSSCFFGEPMYYHRDKNSKVKYKIKEGLSNDELIYLRESLDAIDPKSWRSLNPKQLLEMSIDAAIEFDPIKTLEEAVRLRNEEYIRVTPQIIMVRVANKVKDNIVKKFYKNIIRRADEPSIQMAYQLSEFGKPIPNQLKKAWKYSIEGFNGYQLAKYRMEGRVVKSVDVVNVCHPKGELIDKLSKGTLKITGKTWESIISEKGSNLESWTEAFNKMGHMALLRNIRNLLKVKFPEKEMMDKLLRGVKEGKQLPFRYFSAYQAMKEMKGSVSSLVLDSLEECLIRSFQNIPQFRGRVMSLADNSGSTRGTPISEFSRMRVSDIGNLTSIFTGYLSEDGYVGVFGDRLETFTVRKKSSVFDQLEKANRIGNEVGGSTEHGIWLFWDKAIKEKEHWDSVFIYSDMQAGHGGLYGNRGSYENYRWRGGRHIDVPKLINKYRSTVNKHVKVFCVQIAGYQDTIIPEFYKNTYILGGWGKGIFRFANEMMNINSNQKVNLSKVNQKVTNNRFTYGRE